MTTKLYNCPSICPIFHVNLLIYLLSGHSPQPAKSLFCDRGFGFKDEILLLGILYFELLLKLWAFRRRSLLPVVLLTSIVLWSPTAAMFSLNTLHLSWKMCQIKQLNEYTHIFNDTFWHIYVSAICSKLLILHSPSVSLRS